MSKLTKNVWWGDLETYRGWLEMHRQHPTPLTEMGMKSIRDLYPCNQEVFDQIGEEEANV